MPCNMPCRLAVRFGSLDEQEQSPVFPALEQRKAAAATLPPAERRKMERLAVQVGLSLQSVRACVLGSVPHEALPACRWLCCSAP